MMVNNTRNLWVSGLYPSSGVWRNTTFQKLDLFPSSGKRGGGGKKTPPGMTLGFWTAGMENTRNQPIWHAQPIQSANPVWTFLLYGSLSSIMRSSTHREDLYDVTDRSRPRVFRLYSTDGTTGGYYTSRFPTHREDLFDVTDSPQASVSSVQDALHRWH
jgi:hypothetical protein